MHPNGRASYLYVRVVLVVEGTSIVIFVKPIWLYVNANKRQRKGVHACAVRTKPLDHQELNERCFGPPSAALTHTTSDRSFRSTGKPRNVLQQPTIR